MTQELAGRAALVVGGASGLGAAIAARLAAEGATVCLADVDVDRAGQVVEAIRSAGGRATRVACDVTRAHDVAAAVQAASPEGRLDALVLSAAVEIRRPLLECSDEEWQRVLDVNVTGPFLCLRAAMPRMARGGSVVALGSILGNVPQPEYAAYATSKGALVNLCKQAAVEHAPNGIRVNVVAPSACEVGLFLEVTAAAPDPAAVRAMVAGRTPMRRLGTAAEVVETVLFLLSDRASYISGAVVPVDGGLAARRT